MLREGERAALQFSGGKDSRALLELARPFRDRIVVFFADTGAVFEHVRDYVFRSCAELGFRLEVVPPPRPVAQHIDAVGLPADIVPIGATLEMQPFLRERAPQLVQSYMRCCGANIFEPMENAVRAAGYSIVLRGSKRRDRRVGAGPSHWQAGIEYRSPLWDWSDERVMQFLDANRVTLPAHYAEVPDSLDCWLCTAHLNYHGAAKQAWMAKHHPELLRQLRERLGRLHGALDREYRAIAAPLGDLTGAPEPDHSAVRSSS
jgi:phosphoadenosine phosphosulfate reductase